MILGHMTDWVNIDVPLPQHIEISNTLKGQKWLHFWVWKIDRHNLPILENRRTNSYGSKRHLTLPRFRMVSNYILKLGKETGVLMLGQEFQVDGLFDMRKLYPRCFLKVEPQMIFSPHRIQNPQLKGRELARNLNIVLELCIEKKCYQ